MQLSRIHPGNNPRSYFDPSEMKELEESVREKGVLQPILVRPFGGAYQVIAGERRFRAAKAVFGDDYDMPVVVKEMTDEEAEEAALVENVQRADMSPTEEAEAAAKILLRCKGDREDAARRLGWSLTTLNKRLGLMNCAPVVRTALNERKITLGHAELLAAVTKEQQEKALAGIMSMPALPTVAELKTTIERMSLTLASAIFDREGCAGCAHNSGNQGALFAEAISDGRCTNGSCFNGKTEAALEAIKKSLEEDYPTVMIVRPGDNSMVVKLVADTGNGVGAEQAKACRACAKFGAAVSAVPDKLGKTFKDLCFDPVCNQQKVAARVKAEKDAANAATKADQAEAVDAAATPSKDGSNASETVKPAKYDKTGKAVKAAAPVAVTVQEGPKLKEYKEGVWREAMRKELAKSENANKNLSVLIALACAGLTRHVDSTAMAAVVEKFAGQRPDTFKIGNTAAFVLEMDEAKRQRALAAMTASVAKGIEIERVKESLTFLEVDLGEYWKLNEDFLSILTKSELGVIAEELGLKAALGDKYAKAMGGKKDEAIKALLNIEGFGYDGLVPKAMQYKKD